MKLKNKTAIITGGATGIGLACARLFVKEGARVCLFGRRQNLLNQVTDKLGNSALAVSGDVTNQENIRNLVRETLKSFGQIDILINNAGVFISSAFHETKNSQWDSVMESNLRGVFLLTREVLPHMVEKGGGSLVNVSSILGIVAASGVAAYNVSKAALNQFTRSIAVEYGERGIRCNSVCPGLIATDMTADLMANQDLMDDWKKNYPLGRFGKPEDAANACLYLASDEASFVTGVILPVDGGYTAFARG
tara:strand:+ start:1653 stop:2402 length:750 start_codon:yes stop_codon:yes gene_type:complete